MGNKMFVSRIRMSTFLAHLTHTINFDLNVMWILLERACASSACRHIVDTKIDGDLPIIHFLSLWFIWLGSRIVVHIWEILYLYKKKIINKRHTISLNSLKCISILPFHSCEQIVSVSHFLDPKIKRRMRYKTRPLKRYKSIVCLLRVR